MAICPGLANMTTKTSVQVCSKKLGITQTSNGYVTNCSTFPSGSLNFAPDQDPESNYGMLTQRVDVVYTVSPPIPVDFFYFHHAATDGALAGGDASA